MQVCRRCEVEKPLFQFGEYQGRKGKIRRKICNLCRREQEADRYRKYPEVREKIKRTAKEYYLKKTYGISLDDYHAMFLQQQGRCKICRNNFDELNIDHCHTSGEVRGLLCWTCNVGLGHFKDSIDVLSNAQEYLNKDKFWNFCVWLDENLDKASFSVIKERLEGLL